jgi:hypothetical protein
MRMGWNVLLASGAAAMNVGWQHHGQVKGNEPPEEIFRKQCMSCHVVPDPSFEADRAYIRQVYDTA